MKNVLVAEHSGRLAEVVSLGLGEPGPRAELAVASSAAEALAVLESEPVDVVVIDLQSAALDPLSLALRVVEIQPRMDRLILVGPVPPGCTWQQLEGSRVWFVEPPEDAGAVRSALKSPVAGGFRHLEVLEVARIAACSERDCGVRISHNGETGILVFASGRLVHASTPTKQGQDAFFEMVLWKGGPAIDLPEEQRLGCPVNVTAGACDLLAEAFRFREVLGEHGSGLGCPTTGAASGPGSWWSRLARQRPRGVGVTVACPGDCSRDCCRRLARHLCAVLDAPDPPDPRPIAGRPAFMSLHPGDGGRLTVTFVPAVAGNTFLFETLARSSSGVLVCADQPTSMAGWTKGVPAVIPVRWARGDDPERWGVLELLRDLSGADS